MSWRAPAARPLGAGRLVLRWLRSAQCTEHALGALGGLVPADSDAADLVAIVEMLGGREVVDACNHVRKRAAVGGSAIEVNNAKAKLVASEEAVGRLRSVAGGDRAALAVGRGALRGRACAQQHREAQGPQGHAT